MIRPLFVVAVMVATLASTSKAETPSQGRLVVICYTTGTVSEREAKSAIEAMVRVLERLGGWPQGTYGGRFTNDSRGCERLFASEEPHFIIPSLGFYMRHRDRLLPIAQPRVQGKSSEVLRLLVKKGSFTSLDALKGRTLGGTLLDDPDYLGRVVFKGRLDPSKHFVLKPAKVALRPLRDLAEGKMDAVLVNEQQFRALSGLPFARDLEVLFQSDEIPLPGVFAVTSKTSVDERRRLAGALQSFCSHEDGRSYCELFGIDGFVQVETSAYDAVRALWEAR